MQPIVQLLKNFSAIYGTERNVHYRVHKSPPLVPSLSQIGPVHTTPSSISKIYFNIVFDLTKDDLSCQKLAHDLKYRSTYDMKLLFEVIFCCAEYVSKRKKTD
jgi:hypothetical protein